MIYGYARVSAAAQDHAHQVAELTAAGCERIFTEKASAAAGRKRPALRQALDALEPGDCLVVTKLDRMARSARDALNVLAAIGDREAGFRSLAEPWADTTTPQGRLVATIFSAFAEFDREMILSRTRDGRQAAKARGVKLGRPNTLNAAQRRFVRERRAASPPATISELQALMGVSRSTIVRACRDAPDAEAPSPVWHAPTCAVHTGGAGKPGRCTCGASPIAQRGARSAISRK